MSDPRHIQALRWLHRWSGRWLHEGDKPTVDPVPVDTPDYHALDRLYGLQSEERQERRGLETRAVATVAAALTSVALAANAVSSRLPKAHAGAIALLSVGTLLVGLSVLTTSAALFGRLRFLVLVARAGFGLQAQLGIGIFGAFGTPTYKELRLALARRRDARERGAPEEVRAANRAVNRSVMSLIASVLPVTGLPLGLALLLLDSRRSAVEVEPTTTGTDQVNESDTSARSLREPADLATALEIADQEAQRLQGENIATVVLLRWTSLMLGFGVVLLVAGIVALLLQHPSVPRS